MPPAEVHSGLLSAGAVRIVLVAALAVAKNSQYALACAELGAGGRGSGWQRQGACPNAARPPLAWQRRARSARQRVTAAQHVAAAAATWHDTFGRAAANHAIHDVLIATQLLQGSTPFRSRSTKPIMSRNRRPWPPTRPDAPRCTATTTYVCHRSARQRQSAIPRLTY